MVVNLVKSLSSTSTGGLSVFFTTLCIIDLFGVFPIIALPKAIIDCGWLGVPMALCVFSVQVYTAVLLGRCWLIAEQLNPEIAHKSRYPYAAIAEMTYGETVSRFVTIILDLTVFCSSIPNILVASQNLQLVGVRGSGIGFDFSFCYWMFLLGLFLCPIMWLGSPKDMKWVALTSVLTVLSVSLLTWYILLTAQPVASPQVPRISWESVSIAYGILAFQLDIHPIILTLQVDMADKKKLGHAILAAFTVTGSLFLVTCLLVLFRFGDQAHHNLLQALPLSEALLADELLVTMQICLSMVVSGTALFQDVEQTLGIPKHFTWRRCVVRSLLVMFAVVLGEAVPRFDLVMGLLGGALTGPLMFVLPPILYARLRAMQPQAQMALRGLRSNLANALDIHSSLEANGFLESRTTLVDDYGTFNQTDEGCLNHESLEGSKSDSMYPLRTDDSFDSSSPRGCPLNHSIFYLWERMLGLVSMKNHSPQGPMTFWEKLISACIVAVGIATTLLSTFYTLRDTVRYARFVPPCISNVTVASWAVIDDAF